MNIMYAFVLDGSVILSVIIFSLNSVDKVDKASKFFYSKEKINKKNTLGFGIPLLSIEDSNLFALSSKVLNLEDIFKK